MVLLHRVALGEVLWSDDLVGMHYPMSLLFRRPEGPPEWNPYLFTGLPFLADIQTAAWHPSTVLFRLMDPWWAATILVGANLVAATTGAAWLASRWVDRRGARWLAGVVYAFGGFLVVQHHHLGHHIGAATLPWVLGATVRALEADRPGVRAGWTGLAGLVFGSAMVSGHLQMPMYSALAMILLALAWPRGQHAITGLAGQIAVVAAAGAVAALTAAAALLPLLHWLPHTPRHEIATIAHALSWGIHPAMWPMILAPDLWGRGGRWTADWNYWEMTTYVGILPLALAGTALPLAWRRRRLRPVLLAGAVGALITAGKYGGIQLLLPLLPGYAMFRNPNRAWVLASLAVAILAAVGLEALAAGDARARRSARVVRPIALAAAVILGLGAAGLTVLGSMPGLDAGALVRAAVLAVAAALWLGLAGKGLHRPLVVSAACLIVLDLGAQWATYVETAPPERVLASSAVLDRVSDLPSSQRMLPVADPSQRSDPWRSVVINWGVPRGLRSIHGYNPLLSRRFLDALVAVDPPAKLFATEWPLVNRPSHPWYRALGLRYVITEGNAPPVDGAAPVERTSLYTVWEVHAPRHRAFVVAAPSARIIRTPLHELSAAPGAEVRFDRDDPDEVTLFVRTAAPATVVLADAWAPGWNVEIDGGRPGPAALVAQAFRGVDVPEGGHVVRWRYSTPGRDAGKVLSMIGVAVGVAGIALGRRHAIRERALP